MKIIKVEFVQRGSFDPVKVIGHFEDGSSEEVFSYFSDELSFRESEIVGKTVEEAQDLHCAKDLAYLRS